MIYIYVKEHLVTGLKYFGKTTKENYSKYLGSGLHWKRHLKKYGKAIHTELLRCFEDYEQDECESFCLSFSRENNIVLSDEWANLIEENGMSGAPKGHKGHNFTDEQLAKLSRSTKELWDTPEYREKVLSIREKSFTPERRLQMSDTMKEQWTDARKEKHSNRMLEIIETRGVNPVFLEKASLPKSSEHRQAISTALSGKEKSASHKINLALTKLKKNPNFVFATYEEFCYTVIEMNKTERSLNKIAKILGLSHTAISSAVSNSYLLKKG